MGQDDRGHAQGDIQQHKENQQAHAHQDFRDGDQGQHQEGQQARLVAVHGDAGQRAKKGGQPRDTTPITIELRAATSISRLLNSWYQSRVKPTTRR